MKFSHNINQDSGNLSKTSDTLDHVILASKLCSIGLSGPALIWFTNYLSGRSQFVQFAGSFSSLFPYQKMNHKAPYSDYHRSPFISVISVIICQMLLSVSMLMIHLSIAHHLQWYKLLNIFSQLYIVQSHLTQLKLVLNADKSKFMLLSHGKKLPSVIPKISTFQGAEIEMVTAYKHLGIVIV